MLVFVQDKHVKVWFSLWKVTPKDFQLVDNTKYPLDYADSRFHRALEKLLTGEYIAIEYGKTPSNSKALEINYTEAEEQYNDGIPTESPDLLKVDWHQLFKKFDDSRSYKKEQRELELKKQVKEDISFFNQHHDLISNKALMKSVADYKKGKRVPSFMLKEVLKYVSSESKKENGKRYEPIEN